LRVSAERLASLLRLSPGASLLVFGELDASLLEGLGGAVGGLDRVMLLYRGVDPPAWTLRLVGRGLRLRRSMLFEHNDFLPSASFDAIVASDVLDKLLGRREFLGEAYRLLRPGGRLCLFQRLWPRTALRRGELVKLLHGARSYNISDLRIGFFSAYAVMERPAFRNG